MKSEVVLDFLCIWCRLWFVSVRFQVVESPRIKTVNKLHVDMNKGSREELHWIRCKYLKPGYL